MKMSKVTVLEELDTLLLLEDEIENNYFNTLNELVTFAQIVPRQITKHNLTIFATQTQRQRGSHSITLGVELSRERTYGLDLVQDENGHFKVVGYRFVAPNIEEQVFEEMLELEMFLSVLGTPPVPQEDIILLDALKSFKEPTQEILDKIAELERKSVLPITFAEYLDLTDEEKSRYPLLWESWTNYYSTQTRTFLNGLSERVQMLNKAQELEENKEHLESDVESDILVNTNEEVSEPVQVDVEETNNEETLVNESEEVSEEQSVTVEEEHPSTQEEEEKEEVQEEEKVKEPPIDFDEVLSVLLEESSHKAEEALAKLNSKLGRI